MPTERTERQRAEFRRMIPAGATTERVERWADADTLSRRDDAPREERARAERIAEALGGEAFTTDGVWLVRIRRADGKLVIVGDHITVHADQRAFEAGDAEQSVELR